MPFGKETSPHLGKKFQPGVSGNPAGKPKGTKHLSTWIQELMNDEDFEALIPDLKKGYIEYKGAPAKAIVQVGLARAVNGDTKWADWLGKYGFGTKIELANNPDNPFTTPQMDAETAAKFTEFLKNKP